MQYTGKTVCSDIVLEFATCRRRRSQKQSKKKKTGEKNRNQIKEIGQYLQEMIDCID